jgi:flagellar hook-associated protein 2
MALAVGGLASGLDTQGIVAQLIALERRPVDTLERRKLRLQNQLAAYQDLNAKLLALKARADDLKTPATFFSRKVTSSDESVATAAVSSGASRGTFTLTVTVMARGSIAAAGNTRPELTSTVAAGDGALAFRLGADGDVVTVPLTATTTLQELIQAINDENAGVKASAVNTGSAETPAYKLTLTSDQTGAANDIVVVTDDTTLNVTNTRAALDAEFTLAGIGPFTRPTNTITDVIEGVTITLRSDEGTTDLVVDDNAAALQTRVQGLVDAYNEVAKLIDALTRGSTGQDGKAVPGAFGGDTGPRNIRAGLVATITATVDGTFTTLNAVGIRGTRDGTLTLDPAAFQKALTDDPGAVSQLFAGTSATDGIADRLSARLDELTKSATGVLAARQDGITSTMTGIDRQIEAGLRRLEFTEQTLRARFLRLELMLARLQSTGSALTSQLRALDTLLTHKTQS